MRALGAGAGAGGLRETSFSAFVFALAKAVTLTAFIIIWFLTFSFATKSFCVITAAINPIIFTKLWVFFFL
jgi:hypothetical protein